jgi:hypothetical protein
MMFDWHEVRQVKVFVAELSEDAGPVALPPPAPVPPLTPATASAPAPAVRVASRLVPPFGVDALCAGESAYQNAKTLKMRRSEQAMKRFTSPFPVYPASFAYNCLEMNANPAFFEDKPDLRTELYAGRPAPRATALQGAGDRLDTAMGTKIQAARAILALNRPSRSSPCGKIL